MASPRNWRLVSSSTSNSFLSLVDGNSEEIASIGRLQRRPADNDEDAAAMRKQFMEDGRLMAAAADLLWQCELALVTFMGTHPADRDMLIESLKKVIEQAGGSSADLWSE